VSSEGHELGSTEVPAARGRGGPAPISAGEVAEPMEMEREHTARSPDPVEAAAMVAGGRRSGRRRSPAAGALARETLHLL
jgi:hypothetical protein